MSDKVIRLHINENIIDVKMEDLTFIHLDISFNTEEAMFYAASIDYTRNQRSVWEDDFHVKVGDRLTFEMAEREEPLIPKKLSAFHGNEMATHKKNKHEHFLLLEAQLKEMGLLWSFRGQNGDKRLQKSAL